MRLPLLDMKFFKERLNSLEHTVWKPIIDKAFVKLCMNTRDNRGLNCKVVEVLGKIIFSKIHPYKLDGKGISFYKSLIVDDNNYFKGHRDRY